MTRTRRWPIFREAAYARKEQIACCYGVLAGFGGTENTISHARRMGKEVILL